MTSTPRAWLGVSLLALSLLLTVLIYHWLPSNAAVIRRVMVSVSLPFPLFFSGLVLRSPPEGLGRGGARRLFLTVASTALLGWRAAGHLLGTELSPTQEATYVGMLLLLLSAMVWSRWRSRLTSPSVNSSAP